MFVLRARSKEVFSLFTWVKKVKLSFCLLFANQGLYAKKSLNSICSSYKMIKTSLIRKFGMD